MCWICSTLLLSVCTFQSCIGKVPVALFLVFVYLALCACRCANSFHAKDYQSALKLAEACLLLLTDDQKVERAKTLRVISLSALAVSDMDLAMDSISLAEEASVEPKLALL